MAVATDAQSRLEALRKLLDEGELSTQDELRGKLEKLRFDVTQSTISRDLRKLGAVKATDPDGRTVYKLSEEFAPVLPAGVPSSLASLVRDIEHNQSLVVIHTTPGSASLVARHLDQVRPAGILGTIAGDDTIFVAPSSAREVRLTVREIRECLEMG